MWGMPYENARLMLLIDVANLEFAVSFHTAGVVEDWGRGDEQIELLQLDRAGLEGWEPWERRESPDPETRNVRVVYMLKRQRA
jgi:hypothetical protein